MALRPYFPEQPYYVQQLAIVEAWNKLNEKLQAANAAIATAVEDLLTAYFYGGCHPYRVNDNDAAAADARLTKLQADIKAEQVKSSLEHEWLELNNKLLQFFYWHKPYVLQMCAFQQTLEDERYDADMRARGKILLTDVEQFRTVYQATPREEKKLTQLISVANAGIQHPASVDNYEALLAVVPTLPKSHIRPLPIVSAIVGSVLVLAAMAALALAVAAMVMTAGASVAPSLFLIAGALIVGSLGVTMIAKRHNIDAGIDPLGVLSDSLRDISISSMASKVGLFKESWERKRAPVVVPEAPPRPLFTW